MGRIDIVTAVFTNRGNPLLPLDELIERLTLENQADELKLLTEGAS